MSVRPTGILPRPGYGRAWRPCARLAPFVEEYALREDRLGESQIYNPLPARADCFLQFYLADRYRVVTVASGAVHLAPRCVLVGPHTRRREDLIWTGHLKMFTIRFSAVGFRALFGVPGRAICNFAGSAELVLGAAAREMEERLHGAHEGELAAIAEQCLLRQLTKAGVAEDGGVALRMVRQLSSRRGAVTVGELADSYGLSVRQVERGFQEHVGMTPKVFARLTRLKAAMKLSERPELHWAEIAAAAGYFDQSHMVREFRDLNGATPVVFVELGRRAKAYRSAAGSAGDVAFVLSGAGAGL